MNDWQTVVDNGTWLWQVRKLGGDNPRADVRKVRKSTGKVGGFHYRAQSLVSAEMIARSEAAK